MCPGKFSLSSLSSRWRFGVVLILIRTASKIPWFCGPEYDALSTASIDAAVVAAATVLDEVVTVAAAEAPKTEEEISLALLEETRALRATVGQLVGHSEVCIRSESSPNHG